MNQVFELTYEQNIRLASGKQTSIITAGYVKSEEEAKAFKAADARNDYCAVKLGDDDMWMVGG